MSELVPCDTKGCYNYVKEEPSKLMNMCDTCIRNYAIEELNNE